MANDKSSPDGDEQRRYDLAERTAQFGEAIVMLAKAMPISPVTRRLIDQVVGAGTSVGANYCEANEAESKKVFRQRIATCRKEAKETMHFLRMIGVAHEPAREEARRLWREAKELTLIFAAIHRNSDQDSNHD